MLEKIVKHIPLHLKVKMDPHFYSPFEYVYNKYIDYKLKLEKYYRYDSHKLKKFKDIHKGQKCFIIGTGPSLNKTNLSLIKDEIIFGVNTLYRGLSKFDINCDYYAISDVLVWKKHFKGILGLDTVLFISSDAGRNYLSNLNFHQKFQKNKPIVIRKLGHMQNSRCISKDMSKGLYDGNTIIIDICLQAAYYMGFEEVYLLGCDCDYTGPHRFDGLSTECQPDSGAAVTGDWSYVFDKYKICKKAYEEDGREIINATVGGKLEVFRRKKLEGIV